MHIAELQTCRLQLFFYCKQTIKKPPVINPTVLACIFLFIKR